MLVALASAMPAMSWLVVPNLVSSLPLGMQDIIISAVPEASVLMKGN